MASRAFSFIVFLAFLAACDETGSSGSDHEDDASLPDAAGGPSDDAGRDSDVPKADASSSDAANTPSDAGGDSKTPDGGAGSPDDTLCGQRPSGTAFGTHVLRFESRTERIVVQLVRRYVELGVGESFIYDVDAFALHRTGETLCSDTETALEYTNSHHNWRDVAAATFGQTRYELALDFDLQDPSGPRWVIGLSEREGAAAPVVVADDLVLTGAPLWCTTCPGRLELVVTEVMPNNEATLADEMGDYDPWIEIFNPGSSDVALVGWSLSNDLSNRRSFVFSDGIVRRHEALVVFADGEPEEGALHASFELAAEGGAFVLTAPDGTTDGGRAYGAQTPDRSLELQMGEYVSSATPTPGEWNPEGEE